MNALRNKVQLIQRLGKDAEMITFDDGKVKARFPVATTWSLGAVWRKWLVNI